MALAKMFAGEGKAVKEHAEEANELDAWRVLASLSSGGPSKAKLS